MPHPDQLNLAAPDAVDIDLGTRISLLLKALSAGASTSELDSMSQSIRSVASTDAQWVDEVLRASTALGAQTSALREREAELMSLLETARDLTRRSTTSGVLTTIVERARHIASGDAALLSIADERYLPLFGDGPEGVALKIASGGRDSWIAAGRARFGTGIARICIETRAPFASRDYLADTRFTRDSHLEDIAGGENIRAIIGAPLCVGDEVIGILFVTSHEVRDWTESEVAVTASMANLATAAIENAYLFTQLSLTVDQLTAANIEISAHSLSQEKAVAVHDELMSLALGGTDFATFAKSIGGLLDAATLVVDGNLLERGASGDRVMLDYLHSATRNSTIASAIRQGLKATIIEIEADHDALQPEGAQTVAVAPVQAGGRTLGAILASTSAGFNESALRALESAAHVLGLLLLLEDSLAVAEMQVRGELIDDILSDRVQDLALLKRRGQQVNFDPDAQQVVVVATLELGKRQAARAAASAYASVQHGIAGEHNGQMVFVLPGSDAAQAAEAVRRDQARATHRDVTAAGAGPSDGVRAVRSAYLEATRCVQILGSLGRSGESSTLAEFGIMGLVLADTAGSGQLRDLVGASLGPLLAYDRDHNTELVATMDEYFQSGQLPSSAAARLHVHQNTVYQRLARIDEIVGNKLWREPDGALEMQLALRAHRALG